MPPVTQSIFSAGYSVMERLLVSADPIGTVPYSACWVAGPAIPSTVRPFALWKAFTALSTEELYFDTTSPVK